MNNATKEPLTYNGEVAKRLSIIIISYNTKVLTAKCVASCFASLSELETQDIEIIVVDNNSTDGSPAFLRRKFGHKIKVFANTGNLGFAKANNQGAKQAAGEFLLLLNSDTSVHLGAFEALLAAMKDEFLGIAAASLRNPNGTYQPQGGALPTLANVVAWWLWPFPGTAPLIHPYQDSTRPTDSLFHRGWVGGTALCIRRELYLKLKGLDEKIFMYAEDVDLCLKVHKQDLHIAIIPGAIVTHIGGASAGDLKARLGELRGVIYLFRKHKPTWELPFLRLIIWAGALLRYFYFGILKGSRERKTLYCEVLKLAWK